LIDRALLEKFATCTIDAVGRVSAKRVTRQYLLRACRTSRNRIALAPRNVSIYDWIVQVANLVFVGPQSLPCRSKFRAISGLQFWTVDLQGSGWLKAGAQSLLPWYLSPLRTAQPLVSAALQEVAKVMAARLWHGHSRLARHPVATRQQRHIGNFCLPECRRWPGWISI